MFSVSVYETPFFRFILSDGPSEKLRKILPLTFSLKIYFADSYNLMNF